MSRLTWTMMLVTALLVVLAGSTYASPTVVWVEYPGNPVLVPGPGGSWDDAGVLSAEVVHDGTQYRMWYSGLASDGGLQIGYAASADGVTWTKYANNPVLTLGAEGSWDEAEVSAPAVVLDGSVWRMWYAGLGPDGFRIGYATSPDGIHWTKYANNPLLYPGSPGSWDEEGVFSPYVMLNDGAYQMWYGGRDASRIQIGYATSPDGINWIKHDDNPVLAVGAVGEWDSDNVVSPSVSSQRGEYHVWYQGCAASGVTQREPGDLAAADASSAQLETCAFGHATSLDGVSWTKDASNPVLSPGASGSWDASTIRYPSVVYRGGFLRMWFHGRSSEVSPLRIGYAEAKVTDRAVFLPFVRK